MLHVIPRPTDVHDPETSHLLSLDCWTRDPASIALLRAVRALIPIGDALRGVSVERPAIDRLIADEIGALRVVSLETGRINSVERDCRPSGIIALIWTELEALRGRWIAARLLAEGLDASAPDLTPWYDRRQQLEEEAPALAACWRHASR